MVQVCGMQCATVTFAIYDEAPIACQGDDDQARIRIVTVTIPVDINFESVAARHAIVLGASLSAHAQVWDVAFGSVE